MRIELATAYAHDSEREILGICGARAKNVGSGVVVGS